MSSWFSYFRNSIIREDLEQQHQKTEFDHASTSFQSLGDVSSVASEQSIEGDEQKQFKRIPLVPSLSQEQREHIHDVLRRAQRSNRSARVVMDTKHLRVVRGGRVPITPINTFENENGDNVIDGVDRSDGMAPEIIQMDSLPEDVEITVGPCPSSYCSYASSELMFSEEDLETNIATEKIDESMENRMTIAQRMAKMSRKIDNWFKSLDVEEREIEDEVKDNDEIDKSPPFSIVNNRNSLVGENPLLATYLDTLSLCISVSAIEQCSTTFTQIIERFARNEAADIVYFAIQESLTVDRFLPHFSTEEDNSSIISANNYYIILIEEEQQKQSENIKKINNNDESTNDPIYVQSVPLITINGEEEEEMKIIDKDDILNLEEKNDQKNVQEVNSAFEELYEFEQSDDSGQTSGADTECPSSFEDEEYIEKHIILAEVNERDNLKEEIYETFSPVFEKENQTKSSITCNINSTDSSLDIEKIDNKIGMKGKSNSTSSSSTSFADTSSPSLHEIVEKEILEEKEDVKEEKIKKEDKQYIDNCVEEIKQNQKNLPCISLISDNIFEFKTEKECECNFILKEDNILIEEKEQIEDNNLTDWLSQLVAEESKNYEINKIEEEEKKNLLNFKNDLQEDETEEINKLFLTEFEQSSLENLEKSSPTSSADSTFSLNSKESLNDKILNEDLIKSEGKQENSNFIIKQISVIIEPPSPSPPHSPSPTQRKEENEDKEKVLCKEIEDKIFEDVNKDIETKNILTRSSSSTSSADTNISINDSLLDEFDDNFMNKKETVNTEPEINIKLEYFKSKEYSSFDLKKDEEEIKINENSSSSGRTSEADSYHSNEEYEFDYNENEKKEFNNILQNYNNEEINKNIKTNLTDSLPNKSLSSLIKNNKELNEEIFLEETNNLLTKEELEHIEMINKLAEKEINNNNFEFNKFIENTSIIKKEPLFEEKIAKEKLEIFPQFNNEDLNKLTKEELEHIERIERLAKKEFNKNIINENLQFEQLINENKDQKTLDILTCEELEHIQKVLLLAEESGSSSFNLINNNNNILNNISSIKTSSSETCGADDNYSEKLSLNSEEENEKEFKKEEEENIKIKELFKINKKEKIFYPAFDDQKEEEIAIEREWNKIKQLTVDNDDEKPDIPIWAKNLLDSFNSKQKLKNDNKELLEQPNKEEILIENLEEKIKALPEIEKYSSSQSVSSSSKTSLADSSNSSIASKLKGEPSEGDLPENEDSEFEKCFEIEENKYKEEDNKITKEELEHIAYIEKLSNEEDNLLENINFYLKKQNNQKTIFKRGMSNDKSSNGDTVLTISNNFDKKCELIESENLFEDFTENNEKNINLIEDNIKLINEKKDIFDKGINKNNYKKDIENEELNEILEENNLIKLINGIEEKIIEKALENNEFNYFSSSGTTSGADSTHSFAELYTTNQALSMMDSAKQIENIKVIELEKISKEEEKEELNKFIKYNNSSTSTSTSGADDSIYSFKNEEKISLKEEGIEEEEKSKNKESNSSTSTSGEDSFSSKNEEKIQFLPEDYKLISKEDDQFLLKKSIGRCSLQYGTKAVKDINLINKYTRQSSLTFIPNIMINYTNKLNKSQFISTTNQNTNLEKKEEKNKKIFSKIKIVFTDEKLRESLCESVYKENEEINKDEENIEDEEINNFENIDFLLKLDFYVQRLSEKIAEEAVNDIKTIVIIRRNPRAIYFDNQFKEDLLKENEEQEEEEKNIKLNEFDSEINNWKENSNFCVEPINNKNDNNKGRRNTFSNSIAMISSTFLGRKMSYAFSETFNNPKIIKRKTSEVTDTKQTFIELLSNQSLSSNLTDFSINEENINNNLPDEALIGLTEEERKHIFNVMAESRQRLQTNNLNKQISLQMNSLLNCKEENIEEIISEDEIKKENNKILIEKSLFIKRDEEEKDELLEKIFENEVKDDEFTTKEEDKKQKTSKFAFGGIFSLSQRLANKVSDTFIKIEDKQQSITTKELTEDELEHIYKINKLANFEEEENKMIGIKKEQNYLTEKELINNNKIKEDNKEKENISFVEEEINEVEEKIKENKKESFSPFCPEFWLKNNQTEQIFTNIESNSSRSSSGIGDSEGEQQQNSSSGLLEENIGENISFNQFFPFQSTSTSFPPPRPPLPQTMWRSKSIDKSNLLVSSSKNLNEIENEEKESSRVLNEICWFKQELEKMNVALMSVDDNVLIEQQNNKNLEKFSEKEEHQFDDNYNKKLQMTDNTFETFLVKNEEKEKNMLVDSWPICQEKQLQQLEYFEIQKKKENNLIEEKEKMKFNIFSPNNISLLEKDFSDIGNIKISNELEREIDSQENISNFNNENLILKEEPVLLTEWTINNKEKQSINEIKLKKKSANQIENKKKEEKEMLNEIEEIKNKKEEEREDNKKYFMPADNRREWKYIENEIDEDEEAFIKNIAASCIKSVMNEESMPKKAKDIVEEIEDYRYITTIDKMDTQSAANIPSIIPLYDQQNERFDDKKQSPLPSALTSSHFSLFPTSDESLKEPKLTEEFVLPSSSIDTGATSFFFSHITGEDDNFCGGNNILIEESQQKKQILEELIENQYWEKPPVKAIDINKGKNILEKEKIEEFGQKYFSYGLTENKDFEENNIKLLNLSTLNDEQQTRSISSIHRVPTPISGPLLTDFSDTSPIIIHSNTSSQLSTTSQSKHSPPPTFTKTINSSFGSMFGQKSSSNSGGGFGNMFSGKFSKLTTGKLKDAMQAAGEQLSAKAASAVEKANQAMSEATASASKQPPSSASSSPSKRPHSSLGFLTTDEDELQITTSAGRSLSLAQIDTNAIELPPGAELLSEEEQLKLISVMQCVQLDEEMTRKKSIFEEKEEQKNEEEEQKYYLSSPDMSGLSIEEQNKILEVIKAAEEFDRNEERHNKSIDILNIEPKKEDHKLKLSELDEENKEIVDIQQSISFLEDLSKYGQPVLPSPTMQQQLDDLPKSETLPKISPIEDEEYKEEEEEEDLWIQPPRQEFTAPPEVWENVVVNSATKKLWTTDFTEEFDIINEEEKNKRNDEELTEEEISAETVRGCWETVPKSAEAILQFKEKQKLSKQEFNEQQQKSSMSTVSEVEEEMAAVARSIYTGSFVPTTEEQEMIEEHDFVQLADIEEKRLQKSDSGGGYFEVEMEDPCSPTFNNTPSKSISLFTQQRPQQINPPPTITVTEEKTPPEEESEDEEEKESEEIINVKKTRIITQLRQGSSSSEEGEEDDYPDQVIKAPTVSPASIAAFQEENEIEKQKLEAELLQQIQSFGEAADDEFDVKWAKKPVQQSNNNNNKILPKVIKNINQFEDNFFMEDPANVYSPSTINNNLILQQQQKPSSSTILYRQRTNPFLVEAIAVNDEQYLLNNSSEEVNEEDDEDGEGEVIVKQERLEADDRETFILNEGRSDFSSSSQFDHQIYFSHRPGPVYTINESPAEAEGPSDREGIYHAERIERKPLHSDILPTLISPEMAADSERRRSRSKSKSSLPIESQIIPLITPIRNAPQPPNTTFIQQNEIKNNIDKENNPFISLNEQNIIQKNIPSSLNNNIIEIKTEKPEEEELDITPQSLKLKRSPAMNLTIINSNDDNSNKSIIKTTTTTTTTTFTTTSNNNTFNNDMRILTDNAITQSISTSTTTSTIIINITAINTTKPCITSPTTVNTSSAQQSQYYPPLPVICCSTEMGRRRLPSLPTSAVQQQIIQQSYFQGLNFSSSTSSLQQRQPTIPIHSYKTTQTSTSPIFNEISSNNLELINRRHSSSLLATNNTLITTNQPITYYTSYAPEKSSVSTTNSQGLDYFLENQQKKEEETFFDDNKQQFPINKSSQFSGRNYPPCSTTTLDRLSMTASVIPGATFIKSNEEKSPQFHKKQSDYSRSLGSLQSLKNISSLNSSSTTSYSSSLLFSSPSWKNTLNTTTTSIKATQIQQKPFLSNVEQRATQETLCHLMFKKELREALKRRREALNTCEIEARHRQYQIDRWLRNGGDLLFSSSKDISVPIRPIELDSIPKVIKCSLPKDLIAGARIVPSNINKQQKTVIPHYGLPSTSSASEQLQKICIARSIACQAEEEAFPSFSPQKIIPLENFSSIQKRDGINVKMQQTIKRSINTREACTQTALCAETQTDPCVEIDNIVGEIAGKEQLWTSEEKLRRAYSGAHRVHQPMSDDPSSRRLLTSSRIDLTQQRSHPYPPPWLRYRDNSRLDRFQLTDDTQSERSRKERCIRAELDQRRLKQQYYNSLGDLRYNVLTTCQQRQWPHYQQQTLQKRIYPTFTGTNSLPRGWPEATNLGPLSIPSSYQRSSQNRYKYNYGSLPRDYERNMTSSFTPKEQQWNRNYLEQQQQMPSSFYGSYSLQDLDSSNSNYFGKFSDNFGRGQQIESQFDSMQQFRRQQQPSNWQQQQQSHSLNHLGIDDFQNDHQKPQISLQRQSDFLDIQSIRDHSNINQKSPNELLSEYANFLNNHFIEQQKQQKMADERERDNRLLLQQQQPFGGQPFGDRITSYNNNNYYFDDQQRMELFPDSHDLRYNDNRQFKQLQQPFVYSRNETNYGARPPPTLEYGNFSWRGQQPSYSQISEEIDNNYNNYYYGGYPSPSYQQILLQPQQQFSRSIYERTPNRINKIISNQRIHPQTQQQFQSLSIPSSYYYNKHQQHQSRSLPPSILRKRQQTPIIHSADESWPNELSNEWPQNVKKINSRITENNLRHKSSKRSSKIKRLLLTRRYKYENIFKDLGIRIVGGKKMPNGDLGAFISYIDKNIANEMLGELTEGDQVLEWNGVLLSEKTYEEVERIIQASTGEIELIVSCTKNNEEKQKNNNFIFNEFEEKKIERRTKNNEKEEKFNRNNKQINSDCWHSPNEPPPVPAHQSSNSISDEEEKEDENLIKQQQKNNKEYSLINNLKEYPFINNGKSARLNGSHGYLQLALAYAPQEELLQVYILAARALPFSENGIPPNAYVKIYLLPGRKVENKRRTKYQPKTSNPVWDQLIEYKIGADRLASHFLELTVYNYERDRRSENQPLGQCLVSLGDTSIVFSGTPRWFALQQPSFSYSSINGETTEFNLLNNQQNDRFFDYNPVTLDMLNGYSMIS